MRTLSGHLTITVSDVVKVISIVRVTSAGPDQNYKWVRKFWLCSVTVSSFTCNNITLPLHLTFALR